MTDFEKLRTNIENILDKGFDNHIPLTSNYLAKELIDAYSDDNREVGLNELCETVNKNLDEYETKFKAKLEQILRDNNLCETVVRRDGLKGTLVVMKLGGENRTIIPYSAAFYPTNSKSRRVDTAAYKAKTPEEYFKNILETYRALHN